MPLLIFLFLAIILPLLVSLLLSRTILKGKRKLVKIPIYIVSIFAVWLALFHVGSILYPNKAQKEFASTFNMHSLHAKLICDNGDAGVGPDNTSPWYSTFYAVPSSPYLTESLKQMANSKEYHLTTDTETINSLTKVLPSWEQQDRQPYKANNDYLTAKKDKTILNVAIYRSGNVILACADSRKWGKTVNATSDTNVVTIYTSISSY